MSKLASTGKMDPKKKESLITAAIFGAMLLIIAAASILWSINANKNKGVEDGVTVYKAECLGKEVAQSNYTFDELPADATIGDLKQIVGIVPYLPTDGVLKNFIASGAAKCTPTVNGENQTDDVAVMVRMVDSGNSLRECYAVVSKSDKLLITGDYEPYNIDPDENEDNWSYLNNFRFKLYRVTFNGVDTDMFFALFTRGNRAWRIEYTNLTQEEVITSLKEFFYSEA